MMLKEFEVWKDGQRIVTIWTMEDRPALPDPNEFEIREIPRRFATEPHDIFTHPDSPLNT